MFNNVIYFIIVILLYDISFPGSRPETSLPLSLALFFLFWLAFALYCNLAFQRLLARSSGEEEGKFGLAGRYQGLVLRLSILAILLFAGDVWLLHLKYWLHAIPLIGGVSAIQGILALMVFMFYLMTVWFFGHSVYVLAFRTELTRRSFVFSNVKLNVPIVFPYVSLSLVFDLLSLISWPALQQFLSELAGQMLFFAMFLGVLMIFMPSFIQYWWGCKPFAASEKAEAMREFLREKGFKYREMVQWPIFEGRMLTAGIMGLVPRYRYILVTQSLMDILSEEELKAVLAHEMGHAKYRHLLFYLFFFLGFMGLSFGLFNLSLYFLESHPFFSHLLQEGDARSASLFYILLSLPILMTMFVYFRYVMGFFMRHFERQADLYSAQSMGSPRLTISSLEKIALLGGRIRDLPSWHHFSIRERVDCLWRTTEEPGLVKRHNRFVASAFVVYLVAMVGLTYLFNFSPVKENLLYGWLEQALHRQIEAQPHNLQLYENLAMVYQRLGQDREAIKTYEQLIQLDPYQSLALNNLSWLLATTEDKSLRDDHRALALAKEAVSLERSPVYLDTLAEAYYVNGMIPEAVNTIKEAIALAKSNKEYYESQLRKFQGKRGSG
jgi:Zn-dependent protease with chaperone function